MNPTNMDFIEKPVKHKERIQGQYSFPCIAKNTPLMTKVKEWPSFLNIVRSVDFAINH